MAGIGWSVLQCGAGPGMMQRGGACIDMVWRGLSKVFLRACWGMVCNVVACVASMAESCVRWLSYVVWLSRVV